jgi:SAM-dependent methyltransferase
LWNSSCSDSIVVCPVCGSPSFHILRTAIDIERESLRRQRFVTSRLGHSPSGLEGTDLTHFMHGDAAKVVVCSLCGTLRRWEEHPANYEADRYDAELLRLLYPRYLQAFERKRRHYEPLLPPRAEVLEIGSHVGAFLETAENWGWRATGLDIGAETSVFARHQGARVKRIALEDYSARLRPPDAVFIWNCFEQLGDPQRSLKETRRLLARHGLVVLRVPNGDFYRQGIGRGRRSLRLLGYNNLLGFPYLNGYSVGSLERMLRAAKFEPIAAFATSLLTPPYPEMRPPLRHEWRTLENEAEHAGVRRSPWIEVVGRI